MALVYLADPSHVADLLLAASSPLLGGALLVAIADRVMMIGKWYPLLRVQYPSVSVVNAGRVYLASGLAYYILPSSVGADVLRAVALGRGRRAVVEIGASIAAERVLGLLAAAIMAVIAVALAARDGIPLTFVVPSAVLSAGLGVGALLLPMSERAVRKLQRVTRGRAGSAWSGYLERFGVAYATYRRHRSMVVVAALLTLLEQFLPVLLMWLAAHALGIAIGFGPMLVVMTLTLFAARLPISLGGLGVGEGALVYLLGLYGVAASGALALAVLSRVLDVLVNVGPSVLLWRDLVKGRRAALASQAN